MTRRSSSGLLNFAAHSPEDANETENAVLRAWYTMHCMVSRQNKSGLVIDPGAALPVAEALRSFTIDAAYSCGMESDRGSLEPGKRADLAVLTKDPFAIPVSRLKEVTSELTMIAGQPAWPPAP